MPSSSRNEKLYTALQRRDLNQSQVARRIGVHPSLVNRWFTGKEEPTARQARTLMKMLGVESLRDIDYEIYREERVRRRGRDDEDNSRIGPDGTE